MPKKTIQVKKDNNDISITIENNLNTNNKQIIHSPIARRRRKKKVENNDEIDEVQELPPLTDTSYIKPGPVGAFKMLRPAQPGAGGGAEAQEISFDNFQRFLDMLMENQRNGNPANNVRPPRAWGRNLVDDNPDDDPDDNPGARPLPKPEDISFRDLVLDDDPGIRPPPQPEDDDAFIRPPPQPEDDDPFIIPPPQHEDDDPCIRPPPLPSVALKKLLKTMSPVKAAYYRKLNDVYKDFLIKELDTGPRKDTESDDDDDDTFNQSSQQYV